MLAFGCDTSYESTTTADSATVPPPPFTLSFERNRAKQMELDCTPTSASVLCEKHLIKSSLSRN